MESISYLKHFGNRLADLRKQYDMNQVRFYRFLFPNEYKDEENIKKKMNALEHGKQKSIDLELLLTVCDKCHVSADYILGLDTMYRNHEDRFVCEYTGLDNKAVEQLHAWAEAKSNGADLSVIRNGCSGPDYSKRIESAYRKQNAIQFLKIINLLFVEGKRKKNLGVKIFNEHYTNLSILYDLYLMCFEKPKRISGKLYGKRIKEIIEYENPSPLYWEIKDNMDYMSLDASEKMMLQGISEVFYPVNLKSVFEQLAKERLLQDLDWLIEQTKMDNSSNII